MPVQPLQLPPSPRVAVFRAMVKILQADPTVRRVVKTWKVYDGARKSVAAFGDAELPGVRIARANGPAEFYTPDAQKTAVYLDVTLEVRGWSSDDIDNLWYAIERAFYPPNPGGTEPTPGQAIRQSLIDDGAWDGLAEFTLPAYDPEQAHEGGDRLVARGQIKIDVVLQFNT